MINIQYWHIFAEESHIALHALTKEAICFYLQNLTRQSRHLSLVGEKQPASRFSHVSITSAQFPSGIPSSPSPWNISVVSLWCFHLHGGTRDFKEIQQLATCRQVGCSGLDGSVSFLTPAFVLLCLLRSVRAPSNCYMLQASRSHKTMKMLMVVEAIRQVLQNVWNQQIGLLL